MGRNTFDAEGLVVENMSLDFSAGCRELKSVWVEIRKVALHPLRILFSPSNHKALGRLPET